MLLGKKMSKMREGRKTSEHWPGKITPDLWQGWFSLDSPRDFAAFSKHLQKRLDLCILNALIFKATRGQAQDF